MLWGAIQGLVPLIQWIVKTIFGVFRLRDWWAVGQSGGYDLSRSSADPPIGGMSRLGLTMAGLIFLRTAFSPCTMIVTYPKKRRSGDSLRPCTPVLSNSSKDILLFICDGTFGWVRKCDSDYRGAAR
jgi:hypothetical protein